MRMCNNCEEVQQMEDSIYCSSCDSEIGRCDVCNGPEYKGHLVHVGGGEWACSSCSEEPKEPITLILDEDDLNRLCYLAQCLLMDLPQALGVSSAQTLTKIAQAVGNAEVYTDLIEHVVFLETPYEWEGGEFVPQKENNDFIEVDWEVNG